jgi:arginyl-tRNA--protein-N-Asp/Glu arginylyltransferase
MCHMDMWMLPSTVGTCDKSSPEEATRVGTARHANTAYQPPLRVCTMRRCTMRRCMGHATHNIKLEQTVVSATQNNAHTVVDPRRCDTDACDMHIAAQIIAAPANMSAVTC